MVPVSAHFASAPTAHRGGLAVEVAVQHGLGELLDDVLAGGRLFPVEGRAEHRHTGDHGQGGTGG